MKQFERIFYSKSFFFFSRIEFRKQKAKSKKQKAKPENSQGNSGFLQSFGTLSRS
jgi:hypothetical protein